MGVSPSVVGAVDTGASSATGGTIAPVSTAHALPCYKFTYTSWDKAPELHRKIAAHIAVAALLGYTLESVAAKARCSLELVEAVDEHPCVREWVRDEVMRRQDVMTEAQTRLGGLVSTAVGVFERMMAPEASEQSQLRAAENVLDRQVTREFSRHNRREKEGAGDNMSVQVMRQRFEAAKQAESQQVLEGT